MRRAPVPSLRPRLDLCIPTGVELGEGQRVLVVENKTKTADPLVRKLTARKLDVLRLSARLTPKRLSQNWAAGWQKAPSRACTSCRPWRLNPTWPK